MTTQVTPILLVKITVPVQKIMLNTAVQCTRQVANLLSFTEKETLQLELTIEEAFCNAVDHFSGPIEGELIYLEISLEGDLLIISIRENGIPFNRNQAKQYTASSIENMNLPGLGMLLMSQGIDTIDLFVHGRDGKETRLTKRIPADNIPEVFRQSVSRRRRKIRPRVINPVLRQPEMNELSEICRLAWRCYGYTQEELLYDLELLTEKTISGALQSLVAFEPEHGNMIGHAGLKYHEPTSKVPELGLAFVDSGYRCSGLSHDLGTGLMEMAKANGDDGVFDCSVTTHTFSQKGIQESCGSRPCCLLMGITASGMQTKELVTSKQVKGSVISHYLAFNRTQHTIYCPAHHRPMVEKIYRWLDLPRNFASPDNYIVQGTSSVSVFPLPDELNVAFIIVHQIGTTTFDEIKQGLKQCRTDKRDAVYGFFPLGVPAAPNLVEQCEQIGFSFAGIMPHIHDGDDRILMQCIYTPIDIEAIRLYSDNSRELFTYILKEEKRLAKI